MWQKATCFLILFSRSHSLCEYNKVSWLFTEDTYFTDVRKYVCK